MSTRMPGSSSSTAKRRIARDDAARAFVAAQRSELRVELGREADRVAAPAAVLRVGDGMVVERARHRQQRRRLDQRHVARQDEPAARIGRRAHAGGDRVAHAERRIAVAADLGQHDDVARRDAAAGDVDECRGGDDDRAQMAGDGARERRARARSKSPSGCASLWRPAPKRELRPAARTTIVGSLLRTCAEDGSSTVDSTEVGGLRKASP